MYNNEVNNNVSSIVCTGIKYPSGALLLSESDILNRTLFYVLNNKDTEQILSSMPALEEINEMVNILGYKHLNATC